MNAGHDALTALGGAVPLVNMFVGEVIFGGVGSGLYGMLLYVLLAVFIAGLMVGRTPEYLGKKIGAREVKLAVVGTIFVPALVLVLTAMSVVLDQGLASIFNPGAHGFTEALYAYTSQANNNGSAFAGYGALDYSEYMGGIALYLGRFVPLIAALAVAGSLAGRRRRRPRPARSAPTTPTFVGAARGRDRHRRRSDHLPGARARPAGRGVRRRDSLMLKELRGAVVAVLALTLVLGLVYPVVVTGIAQVAFPNRADGSLIERRRQGRRLEARGAEVRGEASTSTRARPRSTTTRPARASRTSARRTPTSPRRCGSTRRRSSRSRARTTRACPFADIPGRRRHDVRLRNRPAHLARRRAAAVRRASPPSATCSPERVAELVDEHTDDRSFGLFGEPGVNVLELNLALDQETR